MISSEFVKDIAIENDNRIVMLVMDGLGGLPGPDTDKTALEYANTPNIDDLAKKSVLGSHIPIGRGVTPGSGPAHFSIFGYDPVKNDIGRGALAALGVGFQLGGNDIAARINFCTVDDDGNVTDRRAGRIPTEECTRLAKILNDNITIENIEINVLPVKEHRGVVIFRGENLSEHLDDTDPQTTDVPPKSVTGLDDDKKTKYTISIVNEFINKAGELLKNEHPANMILLRGFAACPQLPSMNETYKLKAAAIAVYPDYKGISRVVGMDVLNGGTTTEEEIRTLKKEWDKYTFFYVHIKKTDSYGEDGNFESKVKIIEEVDKIIPDILGLNPDCFIITGDHSTPCKMKSHSFHYVPTLIYGKYIRPDNTQSFGERECSKGGLGVFPGTELMSIALGVAGKLKKFGA